MVQDLNVYVLEIITTQALWEAQELIFPQFKDMSIKMTYKFVTKGIHSKLFHMYWLKNINNITIKASFGIRVIDHAILKFCLEGKYEPLFVCDKFLNKFGTRNFIELCHTNRVDSMDRYILDTSKINEGYEKRSFVSKYINQFPITKYVANF